MTDVLVVKRGSIDAKSKRTATAAGIVVVEVDELTDVQFVRASETVGHADLLWAAMGALASGTNYGDKASAQREEFARKVWGLMDEAYRADRASRPQPAAGEVSTDAE